MKQQWKTNCIFVMQLVAAVVVVCVSLYVANECLRFGFNPHLLHPVEELAHYAPDLSRGGEARQIPEEEMLAWIDT